MVSEINDSIEEINNRTIIIIRISNIILWLLFLGWKMNVLLPGKLLPLQVSKQAKITFISVTVGITLLGFVARYVKNKNSFHIWNIFVFTLFI